MSRSTLIVEGDAGALDEVRRMLRSLGLEYRELSAVIVDKPAKDVLETTLYRVRLKTGLGLWTLPGYQHPKVRAGENTIAITYRQGHEHRVYEERGGWLRVDLGWIPDDKRWVERI